MSGMIDKGCPSDHPMLMDAVVHMARQGHRAETIMRVTGVDRATVDSVMLQGENRGEIKRGRPKKTESEVREFAERMAKARAAKKKKAPGVVADIIKTE